MQRQNGAALDIAQQNAALEAGLFEEDDEDLVASCNLTPKEKNDIKMLRKRRKMAREKQKRLLENDQFENLRSLLNLGSTTRVEKGTVLDAAIRTVCRLRRENEGLQELRTLMRTELDRRNQGKSHTKVKQEVKVKQVQVKQEPAPMAVDPQSAFAIAERQLQAAYVLPTVALKRESKPKSEFQTTPHSMLPPDAPVANPVTHEPSWALQATFAPPRDLEFAFGPPTSQVPMSVWQQEYSVDLDSALEEVPQDKSSYGLEALPSLQKNSGCTPVPFADDSVDMFFDAPDDDLGLIL